MTSTVLVLPNSLFEDNKLLEKYTNVLIYEHPSFFTDWKFHKMKLVLHRASMMYYKDYIKKKYKCDVTYISYNQSLSSVFKKLKSDNIHFYNPADHIVVKTINKIAKQSRKKVILHDTPLFYSNMSDLQKYIKNKTTIRHSDFYKWQRERFNILMKKDKPLGGKWSYDVQNRKPFPENFKKNYIPNTISNKYVIEAKKYVDKHFKNNIGSDKLYVPITHNDAKKHFKKFLRERFGCFGPYQDAVNKDIPFGCHSIISPILNIGLITPQYVIEEAEKYGIKHKIPMQSLEGFIRQIIGWRESMFMLYMFKRNEMEKSNHFNHKRKLDKGIWYKCDESTGFKFIDDMINKTVEYGYLHHIERLMYIGNYMLINQISPIECFDWYMTMFIDSYRWVMYGNVYAMSQYSTGRLLMTRPYFSSSSYITKMSDNTKTKNQYDKIELNNGEYEWFDVWDSLYYNFIDKHKDEFKKNYAIAAQVKHLNKKSKSEKSRYKKIAKLYLDSY